MEADDNLKVAVLEWIVDSGYMCHLQQQCREYQQPGKNNVVYKFVIHLDPCELLQYNAVLGNLLLHCPRSAWRLFQQVCYTAITTEQWLPVLTTLSQLLLMLRLTSFPGLPGYVVDHVSDFPPLTMEPRFYSVTGVVCGMSLQEEYTQSACFYCPREGCPGSRAGGNRYIRLHVAGATESITVRSDFMCYHCGAAVTEDVAYRTLANKVLVHLIPVQALQMASAAMLPCLQQRYQAIPITLRDELCEGVAMGTECTVVGIPIYELSETASRAQISVTVEANNVFPVTDREDCLCRKDLTSSMSELYQACQYSPWAFTATLAYSFAAEVAPPGTYNRLKQAMLLSLVSCSLNTPEAKSRHHMLDILAVGSDTPLLLQLLTYGSSFAPRSVLHSVVADLYGSARKEEGSAFVDAGSLVLAQGGVCLLGNLGCYKKDVKEKLQHTLESEQVALSVPTSHMGPEEASWPLQCTLWACSDQQRKRGFAKADIEVVRAHTMHETSTITKAFADRMGQVVLTDSPSGEVEDHLTNLLTQHILENATGLQTQPPLSQEDFKHFLKIVGCMEVVLSPSAKRLLQAFYLSSRRVRVSSVYSSDMPISALDTMTSLAIAHAKLSLRKEVTDEDAVMAILRYEESLASRFGHSVLNLVPSPHFRDDNIGAYIGRELDQQMRKLHIQILQFCKCHTMHMDSLILPEE